MQSAWRCRLPCLHQVTLRRQRRLSHGLQARVLQQGQYPQWRSFLLIGLLGRWLLMLPVTMPRQTKTLRRPEANRRLMQQGFHGPQTRLSRRLLVTLGVLGAMMWRTDSRLQPSALRPQGYRRVTNSLRPRRALRRDDGPVLLPFSWSDAASWRITRGAVWRSCCDLAAAVKPPHPSPDVLGATHVHAVPSRDTIRLALGIMHTTNVA